MKKIIIATAVSSLLICSAYAAPKPEGWYTKGSYEDLFTTSKFTNLSGVGISLGYKQNALRAEGQASYGRINESLCWGNSCNVYAKGNNYALGLHGFFDFDNSTIFSPYLGLGVETNTYKRINSHTTTGKTYISGLVGTRAYLTSKLALDVGYKTNLQEFSKGGVGSIGLAYHFG